MISVSTDAIRPAERQAFWTEAICRSFANVAVTPLDAAAVSGHFEFVEAGSSRLVRFDTSPQCYSRDARLVSAAGADEPSRSEAARKRRGFRPSSRMASST